MSTTPDPRSCRKDDDHLGVPESFEMAYQIRVASDQIRFAIKSSEHSGHDQGVMTEVRMQLLDALQRLETAERHFSQALLKRTQGDGVGACGSVSEQALIK